MAAVTQVEPDFHHEDGAKALQGAGRSDRLGHHFKLLLEADPQAILRKTVYFFIKRVSLPRLTRAPLNAI